MFAGSNTSVVEQKHIEKTSQQRRQIHGKRQEKTIQNIKGQDKTRREKRQITRQEKTKEKTIQDKKTRQD